MKRGTALLLIATLAAATGCTRTFWRKQADSEVYAAIWDKYGDLHYRLDRINITPDPRSRMYDPYDPDREPMPPDDPISHELMHCVDGMKGWQCWHCNGDTPFVENPAFFKYLPWNERHQVVLDRDTAVQVALVNSRDYQRNLEDLYLSALDVTFERFRFDVMFFAGNNTFFTADGRNRPGSGGVSSSLLTTTNDVEARKLFAAGGELIVGFANSFLWQFSGSDTNTTNTLLDFTLLQPLLRGGGKARILERLTLSERTLLANVRQMEQFRRGFYVEIVTGRSAGAGPSRRGGFFGGAGLEGFTGIGGGGFGRVGQGVGVGGFAGGAGAAQAGGYLGLLQQQQENRNLAANVAQLADSIAQLEAAYDAGRIDRFQVDLARQALYNSQSRLLTAQAQYEATLDQFKVTLGLPPHLDVVVQDRLLEAFDLIDPAIPPLQNQLTIAQKLSGEAIVALHDTLERPQADAAPIARQLAQVQTALERAQQVHRRATTHFAPVALDIEDLEANLRSRIESLQRLKQRSTAQPSLEGDEQFSEALAQQRALFLEPETIDADIQRLRQLPDRLQSDLRSLAAGFRQLPQQLARLEQELTRLSGRIDDVDQPAWRADLRSLLMQIPDQLVTLSADLLDLTLIQARAKAESITLLPIELDGEEALRIASHRRRDWMNARAALVDTWRLIEFNANELESVLNLVFSGDITNQGDNPLNLNSSTGRLRVGLQFDAPLTRIAERNNYRQVLIEYQQARREYYTFVDRVSQSLRNTLRTIELNQANFELRRTAIRVAIDQVELARLKLREPPRPGEPTAFSDTFARDLVSALSDLLNAQNDFLSVWVNYEVERMSLDFQLGTMEIDEFGLWIDPGSAVGTDPSACDMF
jgi:outer membrane protein TolC